MERVNLEKGYVLVYDFGEVKLHNYVTQDLIDDQVILLEKNKKLVVIESPTFYENNRELENYIKSLGSVEGVLLAYHMGGGTFLEGERKYATRNADEYGHSGGGKDLIDNFTKAFGENFDSKIHTITDYIDEGKLVLGDIEMNIILTSEAYDIEIPEINCIYTHMMGSDCHSIIAGADHGRMMIKTLMGYIEKNYNLILTSHYIPEKVSAAQVKIDYIKDLIDVASKCESAEEMISEVEKKYPNYSGLNYLEMTANFFFK